MKLRLKSGLNLICALSLTAMVGCVPLLIGAAVGAGGMTYVKGSLVHNVDNTVDEANKASLKALKDLEFFIISDELNKHSSIIKAEYEDGRGVSVFIDALTERSSKITIRIGIFGDPDESQAILNAILKGL